MAISIDPATKIISVPQADLTLVSGTLYSLDTNQFRKDVMALLDNEDYIWMDDAFTHNTEVTVAGTTFARTLEFINGYSITFEDTGSAYSIRLEGSNNNIFDVDNGILNPTSLTTVIPTNSAGLIIGGSGLSAGQDARLTLIEKLLRNRIETDPVTGVMTIYDDDDSVLLTGNIWENVAGTDAYSGTAINRKDRFT